MRTWRWRWIVGRVAYVRRAEGPGHTSLGQASETSAAPGDLPQRSISPVGATHGGARRVVRGAHGSWRVRRRHGAGFQPFMLSWWRGPGPLAQAGMGRAFGPELPRLRGSGKMETSSELSLLRWAVKNGACFVRGVVAGGARWRGQCRSSIARQRRACLLNPEGSP